MKKNKIMSVILVVLMLVASCPVSAEEDGLK